MKGEPTYTVGFLIMAKKPESMLQRRIKKELKSAIGGWWIKIHGGPFQEAGIPDLLGCVDGKFFALEVKRPGEKPTQLQIEAMKDIKLAGGTVAVVETPKEAINVVQKALRASKRSGRFRY
jgi:hypothetical protein